MSQQRVLDQEDDTSDDSEDLSGDEANDDNNGTVNLHSFRVETIAHLFYDLF